MENNDDILRAYLLDFEGLKSMREFDPKGTCANIITQSENILNNNLYSDINVQDKDGNTFLHHAFNHINIKHIELLFSKGADFNIENKDGQTPIKMARAPGRYYGDIISSFQNHFSKTNFEEFKTFTAGYHSNTKEYILRLLIYKKTPLYDISIKQFLEENNLATIPNIIKLVNHVTDFSLTKENINLFNSLNPTPADNSELLYSGLIMKSPSHIKNRQQADYLTFLKNTPFEVNNHFIGVFLDTYISNIPKENYNDPEHIEALSILLNVLIDKDYMNIPEIKEILPTFDRMLLKYPITHKLFLNEKLKNINTATHNSPKKSKI